MTHPAAPTYALEPPWSGERPAVSCGMAFSPDGARLGVLYHVYNTPRGAPALRVWDLAERSYTTVPVPEANLGGLAWPAADHLCSARYGHAVVLPLAGEPQSVPLPSNSAPGGLATRPGTTDVLVNQGALVALDGAKVAWNTDRKTWDLPGAVVPSPDGDAVATFAAEPYIRIWSCAARGQAHRLHARGGGAAFTPDGRWFVYQPVSGGPVAVLDARTFASEPVRTLVGGLDALAHLAFSPDGCLLAGAFGGERAMTGIRVWDWETGEVRVERRWAGAPLSSLSSLQFTPDGRALVAVASPPAEVLVWDVDRLLGRTPAGVPCPT